jgi:hypothetical protein
MRLIILRRRI